MKTENYDVIVMGGGAIGLATYHPFPERTYGF